MKVVSSWFIAFHYTKPNFRSSSYALPAKILSYKVKVVTEDVG